MYVITDCEGVRTLVSFKGIGYYAREVLGLYVADSDLERGASLNIMLGMETLGYTVAWATDKKGNHIYN